MLTSTDKATFMERFRHNIRARRRQLQLTQQNIATRAGLTITSYATIERGERNPGIYTAYRVACALCVNLSELTGER